MGHENISQNVEKYGKLYFYIENDVFIIIDTNDTQFESSSEMYPTKVYNGNDIKYYFEYVSDNSKTCQWYMDTLEILVDYNGLGKNAKMSIINSHIGCSFDHKLT